MHITKDLKIVLFGGMGRHPLCVSDHALVNTTSDMKPSIATTQVTFNTCTALLIAKHAFLLKVAFWKVPKDFTGDAACPVFLTIFKEYFYEIHMFVLVDTSKVHPLIVFELDHDADKVVAIYALGVLSLLVFLD